MSKPFIRPIVFVAWAGKALGRASALAHVRHGCLPILTDPDAKALEKISTLLETKQVEVFSLAWPGGFTSLKHESNFEKAFAETLIRARAEFPHIHRIVLTAGVDSRLAGPPPGAPGEAGPADAPVLERLKILVNLSMETLKKQQSPGILTILWPAPEFALWSAETSAAGLAWLRSLAPDAEAAGVGLSLALLGPVELDAAEAVPKFQSGQSEKARGPKAEKGHPPRTEKEWDDMAQKEPNDLADIDQGDRADHKREAAGQKSAAQAPERKTPLIRLGEAGEAIALLGELPRNILPKEICLVSRSESVRGEK